MFLLTQQKKWLSSQRKVDAPVSLSLMGQCALDNTKDCYIGMLGMHGTKTAAMTLSECDLMIVLGSRFSDRVLCNAKTFAKDKKIIHIDIDPAEIGKNIDVYSHVTGDVKYILAKLCELLPDMEARGLDEYCYGLEKAVCAENGAYRERGRGASAGRYRGA